MYIDFLKHHLKFILGGAFVLGKTLFRLTENIEVFKKK